MQELRREFLQERNYYMKKNFGIISNLSESREALDLVSHVEAGFMSYFGKVI